MPVSKSQLDKMLLKNKSSITLNARYDRLKAATVLANKEMIAKYLEANPSTRSKCKDEDDITDRADHLWNMIDWQAKYGKSSGNKIKYDLAKNKEYGRLFPVKSIHGYVMVTRSVRHYLARNIYTDIDIDNCHPVLIEQLFPLITQQESEAIKYWNNNRSELFARMQTEALASGCTLTRDQCKEVGFIFLYGGNMEKEFKKLGLTTNTHPDSVWTLCKQLSKDMELFTMRFADVYRDVFDSLGAKRNAAKLSIVMQHIERHLAIILVNIAQNMDLEVGDICHDGIFISKNGSPVDDDLCNELIDRCTHAIKNETGFIVKLSVKDMVEPTWVQDLVAVDPNEVTSDDDYIINTDDEGVSKFMKKFSGRIVYAVDGWYIRPLNSYFWLSGDHNVKAEIMNCNFFIKRAKTVPYSANASGCNSIFTALCSRKQDLVDKDFITRVNKSIVGYIHWEDKHYHGPTKKFYDNDPNSGLGAFICMKGKAPVEMFNSLTEDDPIYQSMITRCFSMLETQQRVDLFRCLSRALFGHIKDKVWFVLDSPRDGGKSTITRGMSGAFGEYVVDGVRAPTVGVHSNDSSKNAWILSRRLDKCRVSWSQEVATTMNMNGSSSQVPLDGNLIKKLASGGDPIDVRALFGGESSIVYNAMMFLNVNGLPVTNPKDAIKTAIPFTIMKEYTSDPEKLAAGGIYAPVDQAAASLMDNPNYMVRLQWAILKLHYTANPVCIDNLPSTQTDYTDITDSVISPEFKLFKERIIVNSNVERAAAPVPSSDILDLFVSYGLDWSKNRICKFLKSQIKTLESGTYSINKKPTHCYVGLIIRAVESEDVSDEMGLQI
jgi:hypothetical protein